MSESSETPCWRRAKIQATSVNSVPHALLSIDRPCCRAFLPLFALSDVQLQERNARRVMATSKPGYPCRVSLVDAEVGEELLLLPFEHQPADSPYKASGPVYIRTSAVKATLAPGMIPDYVHRRLMSVRAYDAENLMCDAVVCAGTDCESAIERMFADPAVAYLHLHHANRGCFSCRVERA